MTAGSPLRPFEALMEEHIMTLLKEKGPQINYDIIAIGKKYHIKTSTLYEWKRRRRIASVIIPGKGKCWVLPEHPEHPDNTAPKTKASLFIDLDSDNFI